MRNGPDFSHVFIDTQKVAGRRFEKRVRIRTWAMSAYIWMKNQRDIYQPKSRKRGYKGHSEAFTCPMDLESEKGVLVRPGASWRRRFFQCNIDDAFGPDHVGIS